MRETSEKLHNHRFQAHVEADLVLVERDLNLIDIKLRGLSDSYYRAMGKGGQDEVMAEY